MTDLKKRFGTLLSAHRKRVGLTQGSLAENASLSVDMIARLEAGKTGAGFGTIECLAIALDIDPAELFSAADSGNRYGETYQQITATLAGLGESDLKWLEQLLSAALTPRR